LSLILANLPYLDIHSHRRLPLEDAVVVESLSADELLSRKLLSIHSTAGIHPWWLEDFSESEIRVMQGIVTSLAESGQLWGIGETGLDRSMPELMQTQRELFLWHLSLAQKHHLPVVLHNVRSGSDFLEVIKSVKPSTPWIFHDFRGNEELVKDLLRLHPLCFFSFGLSLDNSPQVRELLPLIPLEHLFLETDDQKHLDIHDIYLRASEQLGIDLEFLKAQVWHNFRKASKVIQ
jgi:TatD DNase family protein